jgi:hypothetical protein
MGPSAYTPMPLLLRLALIFVGNGQTSQDAEAAPKLAEDEGKLLIKL